MSSPQSTTRALGELRRRHGLTVGNLLQGAWALLLWRYSGERDVVFGITLSGRSAPLPGIESMVGLFINTLPLRARINPGAPLASWLGKLQELHAELLQHEHSPLVNVQGWSAVPRGQSLFESLVVFENYPLQGALDSGFASSLPFRIEVRRGVDPLSYPLALIAFEGERLALRLSFETGRIEPVVALRALGHLQELLQGMAASPQGPLAALPLLRGAERHQVTREWNDTALETATPGCVHALFERQAARVPGAVAVVHEGEVLTYGELDCRANQVARALRRLGIGPGVLVGLCLERCFDLPVSLLAIFKAGGAYVPSSRRCRESAWHTCSRTAVPRCWSPTGTSSKACQIGPARGSCSMPTWRRSSERARRRSPLRPTPARWRT